MREDAKYRDAEGRKVTAVYYKTDCFVANGVYSIGDLNRVIRDNRDLGSRVRAAGTPSPNMRYV